MASRLCLEKLAPDADAYAEAHTSAPPDLVAEIDVETRARRDAVMHSGRAVGRLLKLLVTICRPRLAVDVGTFTGNSALCIAEGLDRDAKVITLEISAEAAAIADRNFRRSRFGDRIELRVGPALDALRAIDSPIDFAFIDADKERYWDYYDAVIERLAPAGLIVVDNTLFFGLPLLGDSEAAALPPPQQAMRQTILDFNRRVHEDPRSENCMLTVRDGVTLIRRRGAP